MEKINRRAFIKKSAAIGAASVLGGSILPTGNNLLYAAQQVDISVVKGKDYFKNTIKAVENLGGMKKFGLSGNSC